MAEFKNFHPFWYNLSVYFSRKAIDTEFLRSMQIQVPKDFPIELYELILTNLVNPVMNVEMPNEQFHKYEEFFMAWQAIAYRFRTLTLNDYEFTTSVKKYGIRPDRYEKIEDREIQDFAFFSFFTNSCSFIDSLSYSLWILGSIKDPTAFLMQPQTLRSITPDKVCDNFKTQFQSAPLSDKLGSFIQSEQYEELKMIRNTIVHRSLPDRQTFHLQMSPESQFRLPLDYWNIDGSIKNLKMSKSGKRVYRDHSVSLVGHDTNYYRKWLLDSSQELFEAINDFIKTEFGKSSSDAQE
jgi:hypothetical protein